METVKPKNYNFHMNSRNTQQIWREFTMTSQNSNILEASIWKCWDLFLT